MALISSLILFWIAWTCACVGGLEMDCDKVVTSGLRAAPVIALLKAIAALLALVSMIDLSPVNWLLSSEEEMSELFAGKVGSYAIILPKVRQGTTFVAGSLHGPVAFPEPMART